MINKKTLNLTVAAAAMAVMTPPPRPNPFEEFEVPGFLRQTVTPEVETRVEPFYQRATPSKPLKNRSKEKAARKQSRLNRRKRR